MTTINQSIHPRVVNGKAFHKKVDTSKPKSKAKATRTAEAITKHLDRHPRDAMSSGRLAKLRGTK